MRVPRGNARGRGLRLSIAPASRGAGCGSAAALEGGRPCRQEALVYSPRPTPGADVALRAPPSWAASCDGEHSHQAHVPAEEALPAEDPWLPRPHVVPRGAAGHQGAAPQGSQAADARAGSVNRRHRLRGRRAFVAVRERRAAAAAGSLRIQVAPNRVGIGRVGLVVSRAVGGAVVRNRVRRRLRALVASRLAGQAGLDLVVLATPAIFWDRDFN